MCGIAGVIDFNGVNESEGCFEDMMGVLKNRGPDQSGVYFSECAALLHTRLCVVDIENGRQPMIFKAGDRELCLVYNGELYNTEEIRAKLRMKGYTFRGHSDTEVLLKSFAEWGERCVDMFNGIFAFAVWDKGNNSLFIARDRMGVKPFFYSVRGGALLFASELKSILRHPGVRPRLTPESIAEIMLMGPGRTPGCGVFENIMELKAGWCGVFDKNGLRIREYWALTDREHTDDFGQTVEKVRYLVTDSIERQLVSDVPVCTFLSGGLDSGVISAVAARHLQKKGERLHTFSVHYRDNEKYFKASKFQPNSDDAYIDIMKDGIGSIHHRVVVDTPQLVNALFQAVDARDLPGMADVDSSLLLFCSEIKKNATVALSGECADEIFCGYPWYRDESIRMAEGFPWAQSTRFRASFLKEELQKAIDAEKYVYDRYLDTLKKSSKLPGLTPLESRMKEMVNLNVSWFMQTLLDRKDRMSMYHGLEVRVPFCDYRIAEYLYSVPWEYKDYENREKGLLRYAMKGLLPDEILWRKKSPYPKTHNPSYLQAVSGLLKDVINEPSSPLLRIAKKEELEKLLVSDNPVPWYGQLMTTPQTIAYFLQVNYWMEKYKVEIA